MQISDNNRPEAAHNSEQTELERLTSQFFEKIDSRFSGKYIVWSQWDHDNWDGDAVFLCNNLGYSSGSSFLTAYGYSIETDAGILRPWYAPAAAFPAPNVDSDTAAGKIAAETELHTGRIVSVLPNKNSGFVRDDGTGSDYYFNIRSFTHWIDGLKVGRPVRFRVEARKDHRRDRMRDTAVDLEYTDCRQT